MFQSAFSVQIQKISLEAFWFLETAFVVFSDVVIWSGDMAWRSTSPSSTWNWKTSLKQRHDCVWSLFLFFFLLWFLFGFLEIPFTVLFYCSGTSYLCFLFEHLIRLDFCLFSFVGLPWRRMLCWHKWQGGSDRWDWAAFHRQVDRNKAIPIWSIVFKTVFVELDPKMGELQLSIHPSLVWMDRRQLATGSMSLRRNPKREEPKRVVL